MNENINTNYEEVLENITEVEVDDAPIYVDAVTSSNKGIGVLIAVGVAATAAAAVGIWRATKDKREERQIRKLEKKGYVITKSNKNDGPIDADYAEVDETVEDDAE